MGYNFLDLYFLGLFGLVKFAIRPQKCPFKNLQYQKNLLSLTRKLESSLISFNLLSIFSSATINNCYLTIYLQVHSHESYMQRHAPARTLAYIEKKCAIPAAPRVQCRHSRRI